MARARSEDVLQTAFFQVFDLPNLPVPNIFPSQLARLGGFASCSAPSLTLVTEDIPEGNWPYIHKTAARAQIDTVTLTRGIRPFDLDFILWTQAYLFGRFATRRNLLVMQNRRGTTPGIGGTPIIGWVLHNCIPVRAKVAGDFNALSADVSIAELDVIPDDITTLPLGA